MTLLLYISMSIVVGILDYCVYKLLDKLPAKEL